MQVATSRRPSPWPRASGGTSRIRRRAVAVPPAFGPGTHSTQPTRRPSSSAIQPRSRGPGGEVGHDPRDERLEARVPAVLGGVQLPVRGHDPAEIAGSADLADLDVGHRASSTETSVSVQDDAVTGEGQGAGSPRREELLEAAYAYVLRHGLSGLSLRPLAREVGSSPRVLLYLFGTKDGLV